MALSGPHKGNGGTVLQNSDTAGFLVLLNPNATETPS